MRTHSIVIVALLTPCLAYAGLRDKLGIKQNLKKLDVESLAFSPESPLQACPGVPSAFDVVATLDDGTWASTADKVTWKSYDLSITKGSVGAKGEIVLPTNPKATWGSATTLTASAPSHPAKTATAEVHPIYSCAFFGDFRGEPGPTGQQGAQGDGGEKSSKGQRGGTGGGGGRGATGQELDVMVALGEDPLQGKKVLMVRVISRTHNSKRYFAVDAESGSLVIDASGGVGGSGGGGGMGGSGGNGPANGPGGDGGDGGDGGPGGEGGDGGTITVTAAADAKPYIGRITFVNDGGPGGAPGDQGYGGTGGIGYGGAPSGAKGTEGQPSVSAGQAGRPGPAVTIDAGTVKAPW
jgi:hypothetical protein